MSETTTLSRRDFLRTGAAAGAGLVIAFYFPGCAAGERATTVDGMFKPNAWLRIGTDGTVRVILDESEMGQGVMTSIPMILADELDVDWSAVRVDPVTTNPSDWPRSISTGGSTSIRSGWRLLRNAGAAAREMLVTAAAQEWGVDPAECNTDRGTVVHEASGRRVGYGDVALLAATLTIPESPRLKSHDEFHLIGTSIKRVDTPMKVDGSAEYGIDVRVPGMLVAVVERCPVFGGKVRSFDATKASAIPGVNAVVEIDSGVAVVADGYWPALQARRALGVEWDEGPGAGVDSADIRKQMEGLLAQPGNVARDDGDAAAELGRAAQRVEAVYELPYLHHATMEPQNCTAHWKGDSLEIWAPIQVPTRAHQAMVEMTGLPPERVVFHTTLLGGGFGRRLEYDFVTEAVQISRAVGAPVKVVWSREDDTRHGFYRAAGMHRFEAGLDGDGRPVAWRHHVAAPSVAAYRSPDRELPNGVDSDAVSGAEDLPYAIPNLRVEYSKVDTHVPVGWLRSVGHSQNGFVTEAFLDEVAHAAGADPVELRLHLLGEHARDRAVIELAAEKSGWGAPPAAGRGRGFAYHASFGSRVAHVAEVSVEADRIRVHRVVCAVDCGTVINPDTVAAQMQSAVVFGLSLALHQEITIEDGRVVQGNFDTYPVLRLPSMPVVETYVVPSTEAPGGIGEPGVPPLAAALANAVFAATGQRLRRLPLRLA